MCGRTRISVKIGLRSRNYYEDVFIDNLLFGRARFDSRQVVQSARVRSGVLEWIALGNPEREWRSVGFGDCHILADAQGMSFEVEQRFIIVFSGSIGESPASGYVNEITGQVRYVWPGSQHGCTLGSGTQRVAVDEIAIVERHAQQIAMLLRAFGEIARSREVEADHVPSHGVRYPNTFPMRHQGCYVAASVGFGSWSSVFRCRRSG